MVNERREPSESIASKAHTRTRTGAHAHALYHGIRRLVVTNDVRAWLLAPYDPPSTHDSTARRARSAAAEHGDFSLVHASSSRTKLGASGSCVMPNSSPPRPPSTKHRPRDAASGWASSRMHIIVGSTAELGCGHGSSTPLAHRPSRPQTLSQGAWAVACRGGAGPVGSLGEARSRPWLGLRPRGGGAQSLV